MRFLSTWSPMAVLLSTSLAWGQPADAPTPSCEQQVQEQHRQLTTDGLVPQATALQWGPELTAIVTQLRTMRTQYDIKKSQVELFEQQLAQLVEQLRQARQAVSKAAPVPAPPSPTN